ncbi:MAG: U32 family peptidase [Anaeroplasmataceae bacterium]|nr:U32 family peptidase [Anaeroplasmataceae bacterium]
MKLVCSIYDINQAEEYAKYVKYFLLDSSLISKENVDFLNKLNVISILKINFMVHPFEVEIWKSKIKEYILWDCLFYITDLGMAHIFKELGAIGRVIYDPITMLTNHLDALEYYSYGFDAVGLSNEMPIRDVKEIISFENLKVFYQVFGYRLMFHSRRKLVSLYEEKIDKKEEHHNLRIREATRQESYPLVEDETGTYIYRSYVLSILKELDGLHAEYVYLESFQIENHVFLEVLDIFTTFLKNHDLAVALERMTLLNLPMQDGFTYQDTVYVKEEF